MEIDFRELFDSWRYANITSFFVERARKRHANALFVNILTKAPFPFGKGAFKVAAGYCLFFMCYSFLFWIW